MFFSGNDRKTGTTEVKIKISKKQLEKLLGQTDVQGLTVEQVLARLMSASDQFESHQRSWRPALKSIPEITLSVGHVTLRYAVVACKDER
ncbi:hypothetical protein E3N88_41789 [Mikania micrantha]|uniref:Uncharacterized protein n=1 Tax=Mikania micrantha TaxID=192012 RepID=A0A5N6LJM8_9ASTR|nr:hypothetical protein E3N88_41789 [Mikania micrantha]